MQALMLGLLAFLTRSCPTHGLRGGMAAASLPYVEETRPGDNLADMLFSFLFAEVLNRIRSHLQSCGHVFQYPWRADWFCSLTRCPGPTETSPRSQVT